ncbi:MAG: hypothetical protein H7Z19_16635 [Chitinophagaceae bacterium]|nr:hypothetical protein [Rubrivivax sp.]
MLVDVVELRVMGARRRRDEVRAALPVRGVLSLTSARAGRFAGQKNPPLLAGLAKVASVLPLAGGLGTSSSRPFSRS